MRIRRIWDDYGLSITLILMFLAAWALQTWTGWVEFQSEQAQHGQLAGRSATTATSGTGRNDIRELAVGVPAGPRLRGPRQRSSCIGAVRVADTDYDAEAALRRIEAKVDALEKRLEKG